MSSEEVRVMLTDGTERHLSLADLRAASGEDAEIAGTDVDPSRDVLLDGRRYRLLTLVAAAIDVSPDLLRPAEARRALQVLRTAWPEEVGLERDALERKPEQVVERRSQLDEDTDGASNTAWSAEFSPRTLRALRKHRGNWVAVRAGQLIAAEPELATLLARTRDEAATVLYVPANGTGSF